MAERRLPPRDGTSLYECRRVCAARRYHGRWDISSGSRSRGSARGWGRKPWRERGRWGWWFWSWFGLHRQGPLFLSVSIHLSTALDAPMVSNLNRKMTMSFLHLPPLPQPAVWKGQWRLEDKLLLINFYSLPNWALKMRRVGILFNKVWFVASSKTGKRWHMLLHKNDFTE